MPLEAQNAVQDCLDINVVELYEAPVRARAPEASWTQPSSLYPEATVDFTPVEEAAAAVDEEVADVDATLDEDEDAGDAFERVADDAATDELEATVEDAAVEDETAEEATLGAG